MNEADQMPLKCETQDNRFIALAPLEEKSWVAFCKAVGNEAWIERQFEASQQELISELKPLFNTKTA